MKRCKKTFYSASSPDLAKPLLQLLARYTNILIQTKESNSAAVAFFIPNSIIFICFANTCNKPSHRKVTFLKSDRHTLIMKLHQKITFGLFRQFFAN